MAQLGQLHINLLGAGMLMGSIVICFYLSNIAMMARLRQPLPAALANKTNVAWIGADGFTLPWQFARTSTGSNTANYLTIRSIMGHYNNRRRDKL
jgi:hypothetical protein